jgi:hypothetical protein
MGTVPDAEPDLCRDVRRHCAAVAASARQVTITSTARTYTPGVAGLDPGVHLLDAAPEDRARYVLIMDAINFGSGWFHLLDHDGDEDLTTAISRRLSEHARRRGQVWTPAELRILDAAAVARVLSQDPAHELMRLYAQALRDLGSWLGDRAALNVIADARGSARAFARQAAIAMPFFEDPGFYKRAQIAANDLVLAGVAEFEDIDELTVFADNILPHALRLDGILVYDAALAAQIDAGQRIAAGSRAEQEIRACAVHACEQIARRQGVAPRVLDNWLWNLGQGARYTRTPAQRSQTVAY